MPIDLQTANQRKADILTAQGENRSTDAAHMVGDLLDDIHAHAGTDAAAFNQAVITAGENRIHWAELLRWLQTQSEQPESWLNPLIEELES